MIWIGPNAEKARDILRKEIVNGVFDEYSLLEAIAQALFEAAATRPPQELPSEEAIARVIDPKAFAFSPTDFYALRMKEALEKARAILALPELAGEREAALEEGMAAVADLRSVYLNTPKPDQIDRACASVLFTAIQDIDALKSSPAPVPAAGDVVERAAEHLHEFFAAWLGKYEARAIAVNLAAANLLRTKEESK